MGDDVPGAESIVEILAPKVPLLQTLTFKHSFVDGQSLISTIEAARQVDDGGLLEALKEMTLSYTSGITRDHCDELEALLKKLNVHV